MRGIEITLYRNTFLISFFSLEEYFLDFKTVVQHTHPLIRGLRFERLE